MRNILESKYFIYILIHDLIKRNPKSKSTVNLLASKNFPETNTKRFLRIFKRISSWNLNHKFKLITQQWFLIKIKIKKFDTKRIMQYKQNHVYIDILIYSWDIYIYLYTQKLIYKNIKWSNFNFRILLYSYLYFQSLQQISYAISKSSPWTTPTPRILPTFYKITPYSLRFLVYSISIESSPQYFPSI